MQGQINPLLSENKTAPDKKTYSMSEFLLKGELNKYFAQTAAVAMDTDHVLNIIRQIPMLLKMNMEIWGQIAGQTREEHRLISAFSSSGVFPSHAFFALLKERQGAEKNCEFGVRRLVWVPLPGETAAICVKY